MAYQIHALAPEPFAPLFDLSDAELGARNIRRMEVADCPGTPCRVSLADVPAGGTVLLLNYEHQPAASPYRSCHAIFVSRGARQARPAPDEIPEVLRSRLISVRLFDRDGMMADADVVEGRDLDAALRRMLADPAAAYAHLHFARPGCFAARAERA
ncbi:DUF1203 domain-containing protein [Mangrovicoccus sp. HB161399]|uniref:DUF1203 domain-containing protein n=1 Tax=Mangrovicoccus sp. HB161399 TaxID=2720392 RepID=UPI001556EB24|nr:DUF1203 domain-containing protein [Mangrovicoccus sp. HB161399]